MSTRPYRLGLRMRLYARWYAFRCRHGWHPKDYREVRKGWSHTPHENAVWTDQTYCDFCGVVLEDRSANRPIDMGYLS